MDTNRQTKVRQILKAIEYGNIPREEIRQRLQQIIDDELSVTGSNPVCSTQNLAD